MIKKILIGLSICALCIVIFYIQSAITPFAIAAILCYLTHPIISAVSSKFGLHRGLVTGVMILLLMCICIGTIVLVVPVIYGQIVLLITKIQEYKVCIQGNLPIMMEKMRHINPEIAHKIRDLVEQSTNDIVSIVVSSANNLWHYTMATINVIFLLFLVPVISFYILRDWQTHKIPFDHLLPNNTRKILRRFCADVDTLLSGYIRGQLNVCLVLCMYYCTALWVVGFEFAVLLGIITGFAVIVPFVGFALCFVAAMISGYFHFGLSIDLMYIAIIYIIGSILETSVLSPNIIGDRIGIHPLWIIFTVLAAGKLFGFLGLLFAIPIAGIMKITLGLIFDYYTSTKIKEKTR